MKACTRRRIRFVKINEKKRIMMTTDFTERNDYAEMKEAGKMESVFIDCF
jgi:hypothetical protein